MDFVFFAYDNATILLFAVSCHISLGFLWSVCLMWIYFRYIRIRTENKTKPKGKRNSFDDNNCSNTKNDEWLTSKVSHATQQIHKWTKNERVREKPKRTEQNRAEQNTIPHTHSTHKKHSNFVWNTRLTVMYTQWRKSYLLVGSVVVAAAFFPTNCSLACRSWWITLMCLFVCVRELYCRFFFFLVIFVLFDFHNTKNKFYIFLSRRIWWDMVFFFHSAGH